LTPHALRIASVLTPEATSAQHPALIAGAHRSLFRRRRTEPFAACVSLNGEPGYAGELLEEFESAFLAATRASAVTSLGRALLAGHERLSRDNAQLLVEQRRSASAIVAAVRADGLYVARAGPVFVRSIREEEDDEEAEDSVRELTEQARQLGRDHLPHIASQFIPMGPGDVVLLLPGLTSFDLPQSVVQGAIEAGPDLDTVTELLRGAPPETAGLVIWWPRTADEDLSDERWLDWETAARPVPSRHEEASPAVPSRRPPRREATPPSSGGGSGTLIVEPPVLPPIEEADRVEPPRRRARPPRQSLSRPQLGGWTKFLPLLPLVGVMALAIVLLRGVVPAPGGAERSVADAGRIIQEAEANPDREVRVTLLAEAIHILEPQAPNSESARALLEEASTARDRALSIVRRRPVRADLPANPGFRPAGLWKSGNSLFILDLGGQLLYRTDATGTRLEVALRPGEPYEGQPLGRIVTAAWSPARGSNTEGQLLLLDQVRSIVSVGADGSPVRRWFPPDGPDWQRLGASAATFDNLFVLDPDRQLIMRYPARQPGAISTPALRSDQEPQLNQIIDLATDGNLYLLFPNGRIAKFAPGASALPFEGSVPDRPLRVPVAMFAHPDLDRVWVLEPGESRVVEFTNGGVYVRQYVLPPEQLRNAVSLHVDAAAQELRILTPEAVLLINMEE
jgi:hypothetical protein